MYRKVLVAERLPELMKFVTTIDEANEHRVYRLTEHGWNMRDADGDNSPNNNLQITHWLEEIEEVEELGGLIDSIDNLAHALQMRSLPAENHVEQMRQLLPEKVAKFKKVFIEITGDNPWEFAG